MACSKFLTEGYLPPTQRNYPLVIIDGMPEVSLERINPEDIAFLEVSKSAVNNAKHGLLGGGGVIKINTMEYDSTQPQVRYHTSLGIETMQNAPAMLSADEYRKYKPQHDNGHSTNWLKEVTRTSLSNRHHLAINKAHKKSGLYASMGYQKENGILKKSGFEQGNIRINWTRKNKEKKNAFYFKNSFLQRSNNSPDVDIFESAATHNPTSPYSEKFFIRNLTEDINLARTREWNSSFNFEKHFSFFSKYNFHVAFRHRKNMIINGSLGDPTDFNNFDKKHFTSGLNIYSQSVSKKIKTKNHYGFEGTILSNYYQSTTFSPDDNNFDFNDLENWRKRIKYRNKKKLETRLASAFINREHRINRWRLNYGVRYDRFFYKDLKKGEFFYHGRLETNLVDLFKINKLDRLVFSMGYGRAGQPTSFNRDLREEDHRNIFAGEYLITEIEDKEGLIELKTEVDVQLEASFFNGRFNTTINLYDNLLSNQVIDPFGYFKGELGNSGIEVQLDFKHQLGAGWEWQSSLGFNSNKSVIYKLNDTGEGMDLNSASFSFIRRGDQWAEPYKEVGLFYGYETEEEIFDGRYQEKDLDGDNVNDRTISGNTLPKMGFVFSNQFKKGKWDAILKMRSLVGHHLRNDYRQKYELIGNFSDNVIKTKYFNELITEYNGNLLDVYIENASFLKLDYLCIGYRPDMANGSLRLYLAGHDLLTITGYTGIDPEPRYQIDGFGISTGTETTDTYYRSRRVVFGVQYGL